MKKRIIIAVASFAFAGLTVFAIIMSVRTCNWHSDEDVGNFRVRFYSDYCEILGTTEQGNNQKYLVVPEYINGKLVVTLGEQRERGWFSLNLMRPDIKSDVIERVYFEGDVFSYPASFSECPKLTHLFFICGDAHLINHSSTRKVYYSHDIFKRHFSHLEYVEYCRASAHTVPANISYHYNYQNALNDGYYWIDDYDYGGLIDYIPKDPTREGYTFGGWYKESECVNKWDFENDTLPDEKKDKYVNADGVEEEVTLYQETKLYAKWIQTDRK